MPGFNEQQFLAEAREIHRQKLEAQKAQPSAALAEFDKQMKANEEARQAEAKQAEAERAKQAEAARQADEDAMKKSMRDAFMRAGGHESEFASAYPKMREAELIRRAQEIEAKARAGQASLYRGF